MVLVGLNTLRQDSSFTDVRIKVEEAEFPVHKCVLSAFSPYFKAMFTAGESIELIMIIVILSHNFVGLAETVQDVVTLNGVEPSMISGLIDYAYTGEINITKHNVQSMLSAANLLGNILIMISKLV